MRLEMDNNNVKCILFLTWKKSICIYTADCHWYLMSSFTNNEIWKTAIYILFGLEGTVVAIHILFTTDFTHWHNSPNTTPIILATFYVCTPNVAIVMQFGTWDPYNWTPPWVSIENNFCFVAVIRICFIHIHKCQLLWFFYEWEILDSHRIVKT